MHVLRESIKHIKLSPNNYTPLVRDSIKNIIMIMKELYLILCSFLNQNKGCDISIHFCIEEITNKTVTVYDKLKQYH